MLFNASYDFYASYAFQIMIGAPRSGKSMFMKKMFSNLAMMRPYSTYQLILYCNPNLKSLSAKDKEFTDEFERACKDIKVEFSSSLPTIEKINSIDTEPSKRVFIILDDFMQR